MKYLFSSAALLLFSPVIFAQNVQQFCGSAYKTGWETPAFESARMPENLAKSTAGYSIPVVFHIVHNGGIENVSDSLVHAALAKLNAEYANLAPYNDTDGVDIGISFCLATQDSAGDATTGIIRHTNTATSFSSYISNNSLPSNYEVDSLIASLYHWPTDKYLNIYIVKEMISNAGTSTYPDQHGHFKDGLFLIHSVLMQSVIEHEAGHYFGLYHPFDGPSCDNNDCLNDNDKVCDTPPDSTSYYNSNCIANTCTSDEADTSANNPFRSTTLGGLGEQDDDTRNFMDVSICASKYTPGQKTRMHAALNTMRTSLLTSQGCQFPLSAASVKHNGVTVFPNPVAGSFNINGAENNVATVYNALGQLVMKTNINSNQQVINTTSLQPGVYTLVLLDNNGTKSVKRIVKQ